MCGVYFYRFCFPRKTNKTCVPWVFSPLLNILIRRSPVCSRKKKWIHSLCDQLFLIWSNSGIRLFWIHQLLLARHAQVTTSLGKVVAWLITLFLLLSFVIVLKLNFIWSCGILVVAWLPLQLFPYDSGFSPRLSGPNMWTPQCKRVYHVCRFWSWDATVPRFPLSNEWWTYNGFLIFIGLLRAEFRC